jgi:hypothetical protein
MAFVRWLAPDGDFRPEALSQQCVVAYRDHLLKAHLPRVIGRRSGINTN